MIPAGNARVGCGSELGYHTHGGQTRQSGFRVAERDGQTLSHAERPNPRCNAGACHDPVRQLRHSSRCGARRHATLHSQVRVRVRLGDQRATCRLLPHASPTHLPCISHHLLSSSRPSASCIIEHLKSLHESSGVGIPVARGNTKTSTRIQKATHVCTRASRGASARSVQQPRGNTEATHGNKGQHTTTWQYVAVSVS